jgi:hypothetical protein
VLSSWVLIALEHRHVVGPLLILAGGIETIALIVLIPEALSPSALARARLMRGRGPVASPKLHVVHGDAERPTHGIPQLRRRS